jgi:23S rRNA pseudouridine1911/1915/1917 synthase
VAFDAVVDAPDAGARLDAFLVRRVAALSRARARSAIAGGLVRVNDRIATRGGLALREGDRVSLREVPPSPEFVPAPPDGSVRLAIVYVDEALVVVDKPAGVHTHPLRPHETHTLASALLARFPEMAGVGYSPRGSPESCIDSTTKLPVYSSRRATLRASPR